MKKQKKYSKFRVPKYPEGGFNPNTMLHSLNPGENPYSHDQLLKMGYQVGNSTGEYITPTGDYAFYKPQYPQLGITTTSAPAALDKAGLSKPKPNLSWPTRTDYSAGSVGPRYKQGFKNGGRVLPKYLIGGRKPDEPVASAADQQAINQQYETSMMDEDWGTDSPNNYQAPESNSMNAGQYAAAGTALAVGGANTYKTYQDPNSTLGNKYDAMGNTATGVVSAINPLIGAGTAATYAVGRPVRNKLEEYDEQGNLKNKNAAQAGMLFNSFISDPLSSVVTNVSNGIWTPKQYTDRLEKDRKATLPQEQVAPYINPKDYRQDAVWQRQSGAYGNAGEFKMGGKMCYPDGGKANYPQLSNQQIVDIAKKESGWPVTGSYTRVVEEDPYINKIERLNPVDVQRVNSIRLNNPQGFMDKMSLDKSEDYYKKYDPNFKTPNKVLLSNDRVIEIARSLKSADDLKKYSIYDADRVKKMYNYLNSYKGNYALGGIHNGIPNAELEKQEVMQFPNGSTEQVNGPTHENGGVPVSIPAGTQIYSDRLKMPGTKKTFARLAEKYKTNKEEKVLSDDKANSTAKKTAELIAQVKKQKLDELFTAQENLKQSKVQSYAKKLGVTLPQAQMPQGEQFPNGGTKGKALLTNQQVVDYSNFSTAGGYDSFESQYNKASDIDKQRLNSMREYLKTNPIPDALDRASNFINITVPGYILSSGARAGEKAGMTPNQDLFPTDTTGLTPAQKQMKLAGNSYRNGGILPKYDGGGWVNGVWVPETPAQVGPRATSEDDIINATNDLGASSFSGQNLQMTGQTAREASGYSPDYGSYQAPYNPYQKSMKPFSLDKSNDLPSYKGGETPSERNLRDYQESLTAANQASQSYKQPANTTTPPPAGQRRNYNEYIEPTVNTILQNSGNIWDLALTKFGTKYDKENYGKVDPRFVKPRTTDATEALRDADRIAAATRNNLKNVVGGNAGAYMANLTANQVNNTLNKARIREANQNTNTGILNQADAANAGIANQFAQYNKELNLRERSDTQQNKARSEDIARQAIRGIGTNSSAAYKDYKAGKMDKNTANVISSMFTNYKLDMSNPNHWAWIFKQAKGE